MVQAMQHPIWRLACRGALLFGVMSLAGNALANEVYVVQLASVKSEERATGEWKRLKGRHAELLGDLNLMLQRVDLGERGIFFRMQTGPFPNITTARDMCQQLKAVKLECIAKVR